MNIIQALLCDPDHVALCDRFVIADAMKAAVKEIASLHIYVVQDYDTVEYAGTELEDAKRKVKGNGCVTVWKYGKIIAYVQYKKNDWVWKYI